MTSFCVHIRLLELLCELTQLTPRVGTRPTHTTPCEKSVSFVNLTRVYVHTITITWQLNASDARGIDVVRDQIKVFAGTRKLFRYANKHTLHQRG